MLGRIASPVDKGKGVMVAYQRSGVTDRVILSVRLTTTAIPTAEKFKKHVDWHIKILHWQVKLLVQGIIHMYMNLMITIIVNRQAGIGSSHHPRFDARSFMHLSICDLSYPCWHC